MNFLTEFYQKSYEKGKSSFPDNETEAEKLGKKGFTSLNESYYVNYSSIIPMYLNMLHVFLER